MNMTSGPLAGVRVLEFAGLGPGPFAGTLLSDLGADVVRIERKGAADHAPTRFDARGRRSFEIDLKNPAGIAQVIELASEAELLFEGFRPGVMERLGLGPDVLLARNPALVYGRMTGWGQFGPYAAAAGHDINYLAITGGLHAIGTEEKPIPPLNIAADLGGGAMFLLVGLLSALLHARKTGNGQVVDAAISDGTAYLMSMFYGMHADGRWEDRRHANLLDGGAPFYDTYRCSDGKWIAIGPIEPQFYALLLDKIGADARLADEQLNKAHWPRRKAVLEDLFSRKTQQEWTEILEGTDACFAPVLSMAEAPHHPHNVARSTFVNLDGVTLPAPAPRFSRTPSKIKWGIRPIEREAKGTVADWERLPKSTV